jgi:hypothetical protein
MRIQNHNYDDDEDGEDDEILRHPLIGVGFFEP